MTPKEILAQARQENRTVLTEIEAKQILMQAGINCTDTQLATTKEAAVKLSVQFGYPVVLKISSVDITHKSDAGGVKVNLKDQAAVEQALGLLDQVSGHCVPSAATASAPSAPPADSSGARAPKSRDPGLDTVALVYERGRLQRFDCGKGR